MKRLLDALQEGRLLELPVNDKDKALEFMALVLEAVPDIGSDMDIVKEVREREKAANTGIGHGVACPHARTKHEGEMLCAVGWSPAGIEYGAADGKKVHLLVTYYIPENQRNAYLKELSGLAKAIKETSGIESIEELADIQSVRNRLLDWVEISMEKAQPIARARMIKLEAIQAAEAIPTVIPVPALHYAIIPFYFLVQADNKCTVLAQNTEFVDVMEKSSHAAGLISVHTNFELAGYQISVMSNRQFSENRFLYEGVALKLPEK